MVKNLSTNTDETSEITKSGIAAPRRAPWLVADRLAPTRGGTTNAQLRPPLFLVLGGVAVDGLSGRLS